MKVAVIVARTENGVIGKNNTLIWKLSEDLKLFRKRTTGHAIIMGRKTFDSIGKALPNRINIIVSRNTDLRIENAIVVQNLKDAIAAAQQQGETQEIFIIGGQQIYDLAQPYATKLYLTSVKTELEGDAFFDLSPYQHWNEISRKHYEKSDSNEFSFEIIEFEKPQ